MLPLVLFLITHSQHSYTIIHEHKSNSIILTPPSSLPVCACDQEQRAINLERQKLLVLEEQQHALHEKLMRSSGSTSAHNTGPGSPSRYGCVHLCPLLSANVHICRKMSIYAPVCPRMSIYVQVCACMSSSCPYISIGSVILPRCPRLFWQSLSIIGLSVAMFI